MLVLLPLLLVSASNFGVWKAGDMPRSFTSGLSSLRCRPILEHAQQRMKVSMREHFWSHIVAGSDTDEDAVLKDGEEEGVLLGQGAFGIVGRGFNEDTKEMVAIKRIAPTTALAAQTAINEIAAAQIVGEHPNTVQMIAYFLAPEMSKGKELGRNLTLKPYRDVVLIYRLALAGSLQDWIKTAHGDAFNVNYSKPKCTDQTIRIMRELVRGLVHVHSKNVQHRDLKPDNILLSAGGTALIADFGIALVNRTSTRMVGHAALGDFYYIDIDALVTKALPYNLEDDIYSMGEVFVRILYGQHATGNELRRYISSSAKEPPQVSKIINGMLQPRGSRSTLEEVLEQTLALKKQAMASEPRPIVTEVFLGIGALTTAACLAEQLRSRYKNRKRAVKSKFDAVVRVGAVQGDRIDMQDYYCHSRLRWSVLPGDWGWKLLGVFDGHGGFQCARFAARFLPHEVRRNLRKFESDPEIGNLEPYDDAGDINPVILQAAAKAVRDALESLDELYVGFKKKPGNTPPFGVAGSTASVALISPDCNSVILCNIGDSRAALAGDWGILWQEGYDPDVSPGLIATRPHRPSDAAEIQRIEAAGGFVEFGARGHRVNGALGVSRALGWANVSGFSGVVVAKADTIVAQRRGTRGIVAFGTDALFEYQTSKEVFGALAEAETVSDLDDRINQLLGFQGCKTRTDPTDNATVVVCRLPQCQGSKRTA